MATALRIPEGAEVISRHERRFIDGTPWSMQTSYYPMEFADRAAGPRLTCGSSRSRVLHRFVPEIDPPAGTEPSSLRRELGPRQAR